MSVQPASVAEPPVAPERDGVGAFGTPASLRKPGRFNPLSRHPRPTGDKPCSLSVARVLETMLVNPSASHKTRHIPLKPSCSRDHGLTCENQGPGRVDSRRSPSGHASERPERPGGPLARPGAVAPSRSPYRVASEHIRQACRRPTGQLPSSRLLSHRPSMILPYGAHPSRRRDERTGPVLLRRCQCHSVAVTVPTLRRRSGVENCPSAGIS